jgi:hypothetical protein
MDSNTEKLDRNNPDRTLWECPVCLGINAWDWDEAERASSLLKTEVKVAHGSCFDNICGHCGADLVHVDSPIRATCYTHEGE